MNLVAGVVKLPACALEIQILQYYLFYAISSLCAIATSSSSPLSFDASAWLAGCRRWRKLARIQRFQIELEAQRVRIGIGEFDEDGGKASIGTGLESLPKRIAQLLQLLVGDARQPNPRAPSSRRR